MESLYEKLKSEEEFFTADAPTNFTVTFINQEDRIKGVAIIENYGSIVCRPADKPEQGYKIIISRTQLLVLKESGISFSPSWDEYFTKKGRKGEI